jgi:hypothetical protein
MMRKRRGGKRAYRLSAYGGRRKRVMRRRRGRGLFGDIIRNVGLPVATAVLTKKLGGRRRRVKRASRAVGRVRRGGFLGSIARIGLPILGSVLAKKLGGAKRRMGHKRRSAYFG